MLHSFLKEKDKSQLITEFTTGSFYISRGFWTTGSNGFNVKRNILEMNYDWTDDEREEQIKKYEDATIKYLSTLFHKVDYIKNEIYPTRECMNHHQKVNKFLIMTNPINILA